MKSLTVTYVGGASESWNVDDLTASAARDALTGQQVSHPLRISDNVTVYLNMRQVCSLAIGQPADEEPATEAEQPAPLAFADLTVDELKELLNKAQVEYPSTAKKADLVALADQHLEMETTVTQLPN